MQQAFGILWQEPGCTPCQDPEDFKTKLFDIQVREMQFENECEVCFSSQPKVSEVASFGGFKGFRTRQEYRGLKEEAAAMFTKRTAQVKAKVVVEAATKDVTTATRARHPGQQKRQRPQEAQTETPLILAQ